MPTGEPPLQRPEVMPSAPPEAPNARHIMRPPHNHNDNNPRPLIPMGHTVFTWAVYLITLPFRLTYRTVFGVFDFVLSIFGLQNDNNSSSHRQRRLLGKIVIINLHSKKVLLDFRGKLF